MSTGPADAAGPVTDRAAARDYCFDLVRRADKDRFLSALFAPDQRRGDLLALYAFNVEITRIREQVSEPTLGEIRLEWWRGELDRVFAGEPGDHPVLQCLAGAVETGLLSRQGLDNLMEARRFDLFDDPMPSLNDLEGYLGETSSALMQMAAWILAGEEAGKSAEAAGFAGVAYGLAGLMRALPIHRARGQCYVPADMLRERGLAPAHILSGRWSDEMAALFASLTSLARERLAAARESPVPRAALPAFLPACLVDLYLARLERAGPDIFKTVPDVTQLRRQWRLWRFAMREQF